MVTAPDVTLIDKVSTSYRKCCFIQILQIVEIQTEQSQLQHHRTGTVEYSIDGGTNWSQSGIFIGLTAGTYNPDFVILMELVK